MKRAALVTGAGGALGAAMARALAGAGWAVVVSDIDADAAHATAATIGPAALPVRLDVTDEADWAAALALVQARFGGLAALINNAGIATGGDFETVSLDDWRRTCAVSGEGAFLGCRMALPLLRRAMPAAIVNIGSAAAHHGRAELAAYGAAKAAVGALTRSVALHCAQNGWDIRCNTLVPAYIDTPMLDGFAPDMPADTLRAALARQVPQGRLGTPDDVARAVLYLVGADSGFMTGAELRLDGGMGAR